MKHIPLSQGRFAIVDASDYDELILHKWYFKDGYAARQCSVGGRKRQNTIRMHRAIINPPMGVDVDHINMNGLDNRRTNLRICTRSENLRNRGATIRNITGFKGVDFNKSTRMFTARITINKKIRYIGSYLTAEEAGVAYNAMATEIHGKFAKLNNIPIQ